MFEERNLKLDLFALVLLALVIFLAVALATYAPGDPVGEPVWPVSEIYQPDLLIYPAPTETQNACGRWGALAADALLNAIGIGAYYLVFSLGVLDLLLLMRREITTPGIRALGWFVSLVGLTTLASMLLAGLSPGPVIGAGGFLGALGRALLLSYFASAGSIILAGSLILGGLLLCTDYALLRIGATAASKTRQGLAAGGRFMAARQQQQEKKQLARGKKSDVEEPLEVVEEESEAQLKIRVRGRRGDEADDALVEESDELDPADALDDAEDEAEADEAELDAEAEAAEEAEPAPQTLLGAMKQKLTPRIRVRAPGKKEEKKQELAEREEVIQQLDAAVIDEEPAHYELPPIDLLLESDEVSYDAQEKEVRHKAKILEKTFKNFGFQVKVVEIETGPVIAQYEVELEAGLRLSKITGLADDLAIALRVPSVRIVAPIPGKNTVGIEVPNTNRQIVRLREVIEESNARIKKMNIPIFLGKDVSGNALVVDLATLPHLLIAGRTGTGKSVCLNAIITSMLMTRRPDEVRLLMIDPKMVELSGYAKLPHLMHPVVTDMRKAEAILCWAVDKMEERYSLLARAGVRHVNVYNQLGEEELMQRLQPETDEEREAIPLHLPYIVVVADEIADLMMTAGKEVEQHIIRLAQKSRAVGIHLILATQKPTVDVITGLIKSNLPARIAFQVASRTDSRVVLDEMGADKLLGNGDMLFLWPGTSTLLRGQGTYLSDDEICSVVDFVSTGEQDFVKELVQLKVKEGDESQPGALKKRDELYESAVDVVVREGRGSVSLLQRNLGIGYGRAARLIDFMEEDNIVGPYAGSQAREVQITIQQWEEMQGIKSDGDDPPVAASPPPTKAKPKQRRSNKIVPASDWDDAEDDDAAMRDEEEVTDSGEEEEAEEDLFNEAEDDEAAAAQSEAWGEDEEELSDEEYEDEEYEEDDYEEEEEYEEDELEAEDADDEEDEDRQAQRYEAESA